MRLERSFFQREAIVLAQDLLGKFLVREINGEKIITKIVETEAYMGEEDKGAHTYKNRRTNRTEVMFGEAGHAYIYFIYGMYYCLNVVSAEKDIPQGVLIRAVEPVEGLEIIKKNRVIKSKKVQDLTNGPGKLCQALNIDLSLKGVDVANGEELYILNNNEKFEIVADKRVNIDYAEEYKDKLWRYYIKDNKFVSK